MSEEVKLGTNTLTWESGSTHPQNSGIAGSATRPYSLADMNLDSLAIETQVAIAEAAIRMGSVRNSIFTSIASETTQNMNGTVRIPEAIFTRVKPPNNSVPRSQVLFFVHPFVGSPIHTGDLDGYEQSRIFKATKVYYGESKYGIIKNVWGVDANDKKIFSTIDDIKGLRAWGQEQMDVYIQEALVERWDSCIRDWVTLSNEDEKSLNPTIYLPGVDYSYVPSYNSSYKTNIIDFLNNNVTNPFDNQLTIDTLIDLDRTLNDLKREKIELGGGEYGYVLVLSPSQWYYLFKNGLKDLLDKQPVSKEVKLPKVMGRVLDFYLVVNDRAPTVTITSSTMSVGYLYPGNEDMRNIYPYDSGNKNFSVGYVLTKGSLVEYLVEDYTIKTAKSNYDIREANGLFRMGGIQLGGIYGDDDEGNLEICSSALILTPSIPVTL